MDYMDYVSPSLGNFIIPIDELIFFRAVGMPPTSYCSALFLVHVEISANGGTLNGWFILENPSING